MSTHSINIEIKHNKWSSPSETPVENVKKDLVYSSSTQLINLTLNEIELIRTQLKGDISRHRSFNKLAFELVFDINEAAPDFLRQAFEELIKRNFDQQKGITSITISNDSKTNLNPHLKTLFDNHGKRTLSVFMPAIITFFGGMTLATLRNAYVEGLGKLLFFASIITMGLRHWYLSSAAKPYHNDAISEIEDHQVLTALKKGTDSSLGMEGMGHYVLSYFSLSSWKHPRAFAAGLHIGNENQQDTIDLIQDKYTNLKP